jgi:GMP synthase-like glutamine amidotransferase
MILIISTCADKLSELEFVRPLQKLAGKSAVKHCSQVTKNDIAGADKIIISGTALKDFGYLKADWSWLKTTTKPVLGICAGMQVIAQAFDVALEDFVTIGPRRVQVVAENALASGEFEAYFLHTKTATKGFDILATTDGTPCMIKRQQLTGCIFHPEVMNEDLIKRFVKSA